MKSLKESILSSTSAGKYGILATQYEAIDFSADLIHALYVYSPHKLEDLYKQCLFKENECFNFRWFNAKYDEKTNLFGKHLLVYIMNGRSDFSDFTERMKKIVYNENKLPTIKDIKEFSSGNIFVEIKNINKSLFLELKKK